MLKSNEIIQQGKSVILEEAEAVKNLAHLIDTEFSNIVQTIYNSSGRVILTGIGKSANIANKIVATMNSTGTPAIFMHAADAIHGDLGIVQKDDVVICLSKSGNTPEIKVLVPLIKNMGNTLIGLTANRDSYLGQKSDFVLHAYMTKEACPNNLAPTTSTTTQLVLGDALAVCLLNMRKFTDQDFAKFHPGGALGKKLYLKVEDIVSTQLTPTVKPTDNIKEVILNISKNRLGATVVRSESGILGIITDGDIRRMLENNEDWSQLVAKDIMGADPKTIESDRLAAEALETLESNNISQIIVTKAGSYIGIIHLHDIIKEGII